MKDYIQNVVDELKSGGKKDFTPEIPKAPPDGKTTYLDVPPAPPVPEDLDNQELSSDPEEAVEQLDEQAQLSEERQTLG
jgi:hypothetical protein